MSDTLDVPQGVVTEAEPAATAAETPAPVDTGAATDATTETPKPSREERRWAVLSARLTATQQRADAQEAELQTLRRAASPPAAEEPPKPEDIPKLVEQRVAAEVERRAVQARVQTFHETGAAAYPDWKDRCSSLIEMGVDAPMSELLLEMPATVTAALSDEPEELERIVGLKSERARAIALGKFAAALDARPAEDADRVRVAAHTRRVSQAPAPIRPVNGNARVEPNERTMTAQQLVEHYSKQAMKARGL